MNGAGGGGNNAYVSEDEYDDYPTPTKPSGSGGGGGGGNSSGNFFGGAGSSGSVAGGGGSGPSGGGQFNSCYIPSGSSAGGSSSGAGTSSRNQICCLLDDSRRCQRPAGNASYSKRIQRTAFFKRLKLEIDTNANHIYICDHHKMVIQSARNRQKHGSDDEMNENDDSPEIDLYQLQVNTLRRYKKHFKIPTRPGLNKAQLAEILSRHYKTIPVAEKEIITYFIYMIKTGRSKLDNRNDQDSNSGGANASSSAAEYLDRY